MSPWQLGISLLALAPKLKMLPDAVSHNAAISACEKVGAWEQALDLLQDLRRLGLLSTLSFNAAISACARTFRWDLALLLREDLASCGLQPDLITYSSLISACEKGLVWRRALAIFSELSWGEDPGTGKREGIKPDLVLCNAVISACEKGQQWEKALWLVMTLRKLGPSPDAVSYSAAISACSKSAWPWALWLFTHAGDVTLPAASAALGAVARARRWQVALALASLMRQRGALDAGTLALVADASGSSGQLPGIMEEARGLLLRQVRSERKKCAGLTPSPHVSEVNFLECELRDLRRKEPAAQPAQKDNLQDYRSEYVFQNETPGVCFEELDPESAASSQSAQSWQSQTAGLDHKLRKQHTVTEVLRRQHEAMPHVEASRILESLEGLQGVQEPRIFTTEAMPGLLSDTPSEFIRRYQGLSRFQKLQMFLQSHQFEMIIFFVLCLNVLWMAFQLQVTGSAGGFLLGLVEDPAMRPGEEGNWESFFVVGDLIFAGIFTLDVLLRICVLRLKFWKVPMNFVDVAVSATTLAEVTLYYTLTLPVNPIFFRLLRIGKLVRAVRMVTMTSMLGSLQLLVKCLAASKDMLFWSFCLLTFVQCIAGMILGTLCTEFIHDETKDDKLREMVWRYYGTFTRTILTLFEIMFANWGPPCRVLVDHVSEVFSVFFLLYRCVLGFAVLNVVNAVFVQQTMRTASSDEELAYKQRQKELALYTKKVKRLFQNMDSTGDGAINLEEFSKLVQSPKLKFWMSQLELEYHDLLSLFEFLDNGDGQITLTEFIEGAGRLRGTAKAIDIWRVETKVEVLFEEVLHMLRGPESDTPDPVPMVSRKSSVQDVFNTSLFRFMKSNTHDHKTPSPTPLVRTEPQSPRAE
ncbi:unnamed protein product [Effrenium voratum]|nr:unnamed protein product [Effrenium voratum]